MPHPTFSRLESRPPGTLGAPQLFGLSPLPLGTFALGTFMGCAPAVAAYVSAGQLGAEIAVHGADTNPYLLALGIAATVGAITLAGNIANDALREAGLDMDRG